MTTSRFLLGFVILYGVLAGLAELDATGRIGIVILAAVLPAAIAVERFLGHLRPEVALRKLGLGRPDPQAVIVAAVVSALILGVYPLVTQLTGAVITLKPGWPWLLVGIFAFHGLAEELVWRGYAFRRLRSRHSFGVAVLATMPLVAATHVPVLFRSGLVVGVAAVLVAAVTSLPLAYLFETGRQTIWAPAIVHTAIDSFKLVNVPTDASLIFSLTFTAVSLTVPLLALGARPATPSARITQEES
ncbi:hypothetical protein GCM10009744_45640 [Kribbella alba]|uniref:CAAX prenyl protease 2/Lysostaphin resistance protein A-like domain-containing protein n=1 Tax=Kribbella alba TaxID=190197 RepID=A0ABP4RL33_9ACTN